MSSEYLSVQVAHGCWGLSIAGSELSLGATQLSCGPEAGAQKLDGLTSRLKREPSGAETILDIPGWPESLPQQPLSPPYLLLPLKSKSIGLTAAAKDENELVPF